MLETEYFSLFEHADDALHHSSRQSGMRDRSDISAMWRLSHVVLLLYQRQPPSDAVAFMKP
jgi:hypothetical protein